MRPSYQRWTVRGYTRPEMDWDGDVRFRTGGTETVVVIFDPRGWRWDVTADFHGLKEVTVASTAGKRVHQASMRLPPLGYLHEAAWTYIQDVEKDRDGGYPLHSALEGADSDHVRLRGDPPSLETFAAAWLEATTAKFRDGKRVPRRQVLAARFHVSVYAIDKWTRAARDAGLLPEAKTGSPRRTKNDPAEDSGEDIEREQK